MRSALLFALLCAVIATSARVSDATIQVKAKATGYGPSPHHLGDGRLLAEIYDSAIDMNLTFTEAQAMAQHPMFHITPPSGWMNDPNGMFQLGALYHVFYQWNPAAAIWGAPNWGHVVSSDLAHWQTLPPALVPDASYDKQGVFSGSANVVNGTPILLYTGVDNFTDYDYYYQTQAMATPTVPASTPDPLLIHWTKADSNPIIPTVPQGGNHSQFRDPMTAWEQDGTFYSAIGGQLDCSGSAMMYSTKDFTSWSYEGLLASQPGIEPASECSAAANGQNCDQFGKGCHSWECPDYFAVPGLDGAYAFKWSDQVLGRTPFGGDFYVIGKTPAAAYSAASNSVTSGLFQGNYDEASYTPRLLDYGSVYASKSFRLDDGRQLMMSWIFETSVGCDQMCSSGTPFTNASNWQGAQSIPRDITYDAELNELVFYPIVEVEQLRGQRLYMGNATFSVGATMQAAPFTNISNDGRMLDIMVNATLSAPATSSGNDTFMTGIRLTHNDNSYTNVMLNGTITHINSSSWVVESLGVYVDRRMSGGATNTTYQGGYEGGAVSVPAGGLSLEPGLQLRVLVDHSLLEVFANAGRGRISSRIYPLADDDWTVSLIGSSSANSTIMSEAVVYAMDSCWVDMV